jgi:hypothetical protein
MAKKNTYTLIKYSDGYVLVHSEDVCHWGIKGQKWGVRRWQYEDGTLTPEGRIHYGRKAESLNRQASGYRGLRNMYEMEKNFAPVAAIPGAFIGATVAKSAGYGAAIGGPLGALVGATGGILGSKLAIKVTNFIANKKQNEADKILKILNDDLLNQKTDSFIKRYSEQDDRYSEEDERRVGKQANRSVEEEMKTYETYMKKLAQENNKQSSNKGWTKEQQNEFLNKRYGKKEDQDTNINNIKDLPNKFKNTKTEKEREELLTSYTRNLIDGNKNVKDASEKAFNQIFQIKGQEFKSSKPKQYAEELAEWKQNYTPADIKRMGFNNYEEALYDEIGRRSYSM